MQKKQGVLIAPPHAASGSFPLCLCAAIPEPGAAPGIKAWGCEWCPEAAAAAARSVRTRCALVTASVCAPACRQHCKGSAWRSFPHSCWKWWGRDDADIPKTFSEALGGPFPGITGRAGAADELDAGWWAMCRHSGIINHAAERWWSWQS